MAPVSKVKESITGGGSFRVLKRMWREERYTVLLVSVFCYIILSALLTHKTWETVFLDLVFFIFVFSVVFEVARVRALLSVLGLLGLLAILGHIISFFWQGALASKIILSSTSILFIAAAIYRISKRVLISPKIVTRNTIWGAIIIYLLIGVLFSNVYILIEILTPGSFLISSSAEKFVVSSAKNVSRVFGYFSFVTLTTLGYGDILPVKDLSRTMAWLEAFIGQIYLAVIIARLVGMSRYKQHEENP